MKVTKYPQSCLLLEKDGKRIVIDPGNFFAAKFSVQDLGKLQAVLYTHQHADHFEPGLVEEFKSAGVGLYGNEAVAELIGSEAVTLEDGRAVELGGFSVLPHNFAALSVARWLSRALEHGLYYRRTFFSPRRWY